MNFFTRGQRSDQACEQIVISAVVASEAPRGAGRDSRSDESVKRLSAISFQLLWRQTLQAERDEVEGMMSLMAIKNNRNMVICLAFE